MKLKLLRSSIFIVLIAMIWAVPLQAQVRNQAKSINSSGPAPKSAMQSDVRSQAKTMHRAPNPDFPALECLIAQAGSPRTLHHFKLNDPSSLTAYGSSSDVFLNCAEYVNGSYYVTDNKGRFYQVDPATGVLDLIKEGNNGIGLAFNPKDNVMYSLSLAENPKLYSLNLTTGEETFVCDVNVSYCFALGMTIDNNGRCFIIDGENDGIAEIDLSTGNRVKAMPARFDVNYGQDISCDRNTNKIYWAATGLSISTSILYEVNFDGNELKEIGKFPKQASAFAIQSEYTPTVYPLKILGTDVTSANCNDLSVIPGVTVAEGGAVTYDDETKTLTLNNVTISGEAAGKTLPAIDSKIEGLTIKVQGDNRIASLEKGIYSTKQLTLDGDGTLNVSAAKEAARVNEGLFTIQNCTLTASSSLSVEECGVYGDEDLLIDNATVTATTGWTAVVASRHLTIKNSTVTAHGGFYGVSASLGLLTIENSTVKATGDQRCSIESHQLPVLTRCVVIQPAKSEWQVNQGSYYKNYALFLNGEIVKSEVIIGPETGTKYPLQILGTDVTAANCGDLTVIPGVTVGKGGCVMYDDETKTLTLNNATIKSPDFNYPEEGILSRIEGLVIQVEGTNEVTSYGDCHAIHSEQQGLTIKGGGTLNATSSSGAIASQKGKLTISGCTVNAISDDIGITADSLLTISNATVNVSGGAYSIKGVTTLLIKKSEITTKSTDRGIAAVDELTIDESTITATANGYGIYSDGTLTVKRSTVKASGTHYASLVSRRQPVLDGCDVIQPKDWNWMQLEGMYTVAEGDAPVRTEVIISTVSTGINALNADKPADRPAIYTIGGTRVDSDFDALPKGIYIVNGKKVRK